MASGEVSGVWSACMLAYMSICLCNCTLTCMLACMLLYHGHAYMVAMWSVGVYNRTKPLTCDHWLRFPAWLLLGGGPLAPLLRSKTRAKTKGKTQFIGIEYTSLRWPTVLLLSLASLKTDRWPTVSCFSENPAVPILFINHQPSTINSKIKKSSTWWSKSPNPPFNPFHHASGRIKIHNYGTKHQACRNQPVSS